MHTVNIIPRQAGTVNRKTAVPCVLYGPGIQSNLIFSISNEEIQYLSSKGTSRKIDFIIDGVKYNTIIQTVQYHPVTDKPIHIDFLNILNVGKIKIRVKVDFSKLKDSQLVKGSSRLNIACRSLNVWFKNGDEIVDKISCDITDFGSKRTIHARDLKWPVEVWIPQNLAVASIISKKD